ncbi:hypothetical protein Emag_003476 [Eimeria magna]
MWPTAHIGGCAFCGIACATCARLSAPPARLPSTPPAAPTTTLTFRSALPIPTTTIPRPRPPSCGITPRPRSYMGGVAFRCLLLSSISPSRTPKPKTQSVKNFFASPARHGRRGPRTCGHTPLHFCVLHDLVYVRIGDALPRVVLPAIFRSRAIQAHHLSYYGGHLGVFKTAARLACRYWRPHLHRDVLAYFRRCPFCIIKTDAPRKWKWLNLPIGTPFELIAIDLFGPLPLTRRGNNHILVIIDHHTRWVEFVPLPNPTAAQVAQALFNQWISRWGVPRALLSDNGPQFTAELLRQLCTTFGISKLFAAPYNPRAPFSWSPARNWFSLCLASGPSRFCNPSGARWLHALWRCGLAVLRSHQRVANANRKLFLEDPHRLEPGLRVALRDPAKERAAQGMFSPAFRGPYVVERVLLTGTTAELMDPVSGAKLLANRARLKFSDAPQPSATPLASLPQVMAP